MLREERLEGGDRTVEAGRAGVWIATGSTSYAHALRAATASTARAAVASRDGEWLLLHHAVGIGGRWGSGDSGRLWLVASIVHIVGASIRTVSVVPSVIVIEPSRRIVMMACRSCSTEEQLGLLLLLRWGPREDGPEVSSRSDPNANGISCTR